MKHRYLIVSIAYGAASGTNSTRIAKEYARYGDFVVVDVRAGEVLGADGSRESLRCLDGGGE